MSGFHYPEQRGRVLSDDEKNVLWSLRFEPCTGGDDCDPEYPYHYDNCPAKGEEDR